MKKNIGRIIFVFLIIVGCSGCNGNTTRDIRHAGYSLNNESFECEDLIVEDSEDTEYKKIKYYNNNYLITDDGEIYEISLSLKYSNNQNCKKIDTPFLVDAVFDDIARGKEGRLYYLVTKEDFPKYSVVSSSDEDYQLYNLLLKDPNNIKIQSVDNNKNSYFVLRMDGNIYNFIVSKAENTKEYTIVSSSIAYNKMDYGGENIIDFQYKGNSYNTFLKTSNSVYRLRASNAEECNKYADVECVYEMREDEAFLNHKDQILAFNGSTLITTYKKVFTVAS